MKREPDHESGKRAESRRMLLEKATSGGLEAAVERAGGQLTGVSIKLNSYDVLVTLRARFPGGRMVGFVGSTDLGTALIKAMKKAGRDEVKWRKDKWGRD